MDTSKGRGRGMALLQALQRAKEASQDPSLASGSTPAASGSTSDASGSTPAASVVSSGIGAGAVSGRGRAALLMSKLQQIPGPTFSPASDVSPNVIPATLTKGAGRGMKMLQLLQASKALSRQSGQGDVSDVTTQMAQSAISSTAASTLGKNKYISEVKTNTKPVEMHGSQGQPIEVTANFIRLNFKESSVFEYEVRYDPDQDHKQMRFKLLNEHHHFFQNKTFDGTTLYVPHQLPDEALNLVSVNPFDESKVNIKITFRRPRHLSEMVHLYNVLFKSIMRDLEMVRFGRQNFNQRAAVQIPQHKLEVWPGYVTAVDEYEGGLMLTLDSTSRVLRTQTVLSFIKETVNLQGTNWKRAMSDTLIGCSVMTTYNKKLFRVDSIDDTMNPRSTFEKNDKGRIVQISYIDYYMKNYGIEIMDHDQPMLISRQTKHMSGSDKPIDFMICLVPELCQLTGLTDDQRNNFRLMKDVATYTRITPNQRFQAFKQFIQSVLNNPKANGRLQGWGLSIAKETIELTARTLPPEPLTFGNNVKIPGKPNAEWNNEVTKNAVMSAVDILNWVVVYTERDANCTKDFLEVIKRNCRPMGIMIKDPALVKLKNDRTDSYITALKQCITSAVQIVVAICPTSRDDRYAAIKRICCADNPVPSQVINARTIMNQAKIRAITQKILLQMNCKLGGTLWHITIPFKTCMVIGIDAYHETVKKYNSVCAFVASYNPSMTQWYSRVVIQQKGQEISDSLKTCFGDALKFYSQVNGKFPDKIIVYRDGVGDGQLKTLRDYEIPQLKNSIISLGETYTPMITYIVVQKRINSRIFMKCGGGFENPFPGTVVDNSITRRDWYDFLIASQKVNQGTVTPTHYVVVHDDSSMPPDHCQRLTYKLCHLYYNWPGTVRVPAPCQYAHKLAFLVGQSIKQKPADQLCDKLFFL